MDSMAYGRAAVPWEYQAACANDVLGEHHKWKQKSPKKTRKIVVDPEYRKKNITRVVY